MPLVVIDLGSAFARVCLGGDAAPRAAARSPPALRRALREAGLVGSGGGGGGGGNGDVAVGDGDDKGEGEGGVALLAEQLAACLGPLVVRGLLLRGAGEARVVLVEPALWPERARAAARAALLAHVGAAQLRLVPHALACAAACARATALVVDCGADECRVTPVVLGAELPQRLGGSGAAAPPPGGAAVAACAAALLLAALARAVAAAPPPAAQLQPPAQAPAAAAGPLSVRASAAAGGGRAFGLDLLAVGAEAAGSERLAVVELPALGAGAGADAGAGEAEGDAPLRPAAGAAGGSVLEALLAQWAETCAFERGAVSGAAAGRAGPRPHAEGAGVMLDLPVPPALVRALALRQPCAVALPAAAWRRCFDMPFDVSAAGEVAAAARALEPAETAADANAEANANADANAAQAQAPNWALAALSPLRARARAALAALARRDFAPLHLAVADALRHAPADARRQLAASLVLAGGLAAAPGFGARLLGELAAAVDARFDLRASLARHARLGPDAAFEQARREAAARVEEEAAAAGRGRGRGDGRGDADGGSRGHGGGGDCAGLRALRPLLPFLCLANTVAPPSVALAGGSVIGSALAATPRLVAAVRVPGAAAVTPAAGAELTRSDALAESSQHRAPRGGNAAAAAAAAVVTKAAAPSAPAPAVAPMVAARASAPPPAAAVAPKPAPAAAAAAPAPAAPPPPSNAARLESLSARLRSVSTTKK